MNATMPRRGQWFCAAAFLILCRLPLFPLDARAYRREFARNWREAETYAAEIRPLLARALGDPLMVSVGMAVVFPELSRYSYIRDAAETSMLELFYIMNNAGNFSIGKFQMKPAFAAGIERDAASTCRERFPALFETGRSERDARLLRVERLKNLARQTEYFAAFLIFMEKRFPFLRREPERMVRVFSSAYNAGYERSLEQLEALAALSQFPYGKFGVREQYSYCDIALSYYREAAAKGAKEEEGSGNGQ
jgi:hypothetical protein